jgi:uncharacterized protein involved in exopolysaccharide biosynthesis
MELSEYFKIIGRYWWIIALAMLAAGSGAGLYDTVRKPEYSGSASLVLRPSPSIVDSRTLVDLVSELGSRYVSGTYVQSVTSKPVRDAARLSVGLSAEEADRYPLQASALPDTIVIEVSGKGPDPTILRDYLDATVSATVSNTRTLLGVIELQPLEPAAVPDTPTSPRPIRDVSLAVAFGLVLGILLALSLHYLRTSASERRDAALQEILVRTQLRFDRPPGES